MSDKPVTFADLHFTSRTESSSYFLGNDKVDLDPLLAFMQSEITRDEQKEESSLPRESRGAISKVSIGEDDFVLRKYRRGGIFRNILKDKFFHPCRELCDSRPVDELLVLCHLHQSGVSVPEPTAVFLKKTPLKLWYKAVIATQAIASKNLLHTLTDLPVGERMSLLAKSAGEQARMMLDAGVFHRDLHPGNVLVTEQNQVCLIDFDKAEWIDLKRGIDRELAYVVQRWERSVKKHSLNQSVIDAFNQGVGFEQS